MASQINASNSGFGGIVSTGDSSGVLQLQTTGTTAVTIDTSQRAAFVAGTAALPAITTTGDTNTGMFFPAADTIAFAEGGTEAMRLDSSGNVGIGTTSPSYKLQASNTNGDTQVGIYDLASGSSAARLDIRTSGTGASQWLIQTGNTASGLNGALRFYDQTVTTERMRIDSGGAVLMGKTTTDDTNVGFAYRTAGYISVVRSAGAPCYFNRIGTDGAVVEIANDSSTVGTISVSGSSTAYNTSSDYRLKENIVPMTGALATVQALKPVTYKWKIDGSDGQGFIAHELQEVVPDCVSGEKDAVDEEGKPVHQGVDTSFLVATLTAAIQEQQTIINDLKARIETLEAK